MREIYLGVYEHNAVARALYASLGFRVAEVSPEPIEVDGESWTPLEMVLSVPGR